MSRPFRWVVLLAAALVCTLGVIRNRIFEQAIWEPAGQHRLLIYTAAFAAIACTLFFFRRTCLVPCFLTWLVVYGAALAGPRSICALVFFITACYGIGLLVLRAVALPRGEGRCLAIVIGFAVWSVIASLLAFTSWNTAAVYIVILLAPAGAGCWSFFSSSRNIPRVEYWTSALFLYVIGAQFLMCLKPEVSADGVSTHLAIPMYVAYHHSWHFDVTQVSWAVMTMAVDWCFTTLYLLGGEFAAKLLPFCFLIVNATLVAHLCRRYASRNMALLIATAYAATPVIQLTTGSMFTDNVWTAFMLGAVVAILASTHLRQPAYLVIGGGFLGAALATKLVALAFVLPCVAWMLATCWSLREHCGQRKAITALVGGFGFLALVAAPPFLTAWWKTGSPVFPFLNAIFRSPYFDMAKSFDDPRFKTPLTWHAPFDLTFHTSRFNESQDGALGLTYLVIFLLMLSAPRSVFTREIVSVLAVAAAFFTITWSTSAYLRYLIPALILLFVPFARYMEIIRAEQTALYRAIGAVLVLTIIAGVYLLPSSGYWHKGFCLSPLHLREETAAYVEQTAPSRILVDHLNRTAPHEPVAFFTNGIAGLEARAYSTGLHNFTFLRECQAAGSGALIRDLMVRNRIRHFVTPLARCGQAPLPQLDKFLARYTHERFRAGCLYVADLNTAE